MWGNRGVGSPGWAQRAIVLLAGWAVAVLATGCASYDERLARFSESYGAGDFVAAEEHIDRLIARESKVKKRVVTESHGLSEAIHPDRKNTCLLLLEKGMVRLARGDLDSAIDLFRRSRDTLDQRPGISVKGLFSSVSDDTVRPFRGADYEHIMTRVMLALADLLMEGKDAYSYALQIGETQEKILGDSFGEGLEDAEGNKVSYNPRKLYRRVAVGAYMEGIIHEANYSADSAAQAYNRARSWSAGVGLLEAAYERATAGRYAPPEEGVLHVFYLAGRGPRLVESTSPITDLALTLAKVGVLIAGSGYEFLGQAPVPVPAVFASDTAIGPLFIRLPDGSTAGTEVILDVNRIAAEQLEANMPWTLARAVVRRAVKAAAAAVVRKQVQKQSGKDAGIIAGVLTSLVTTAIENADTRNWKSLPAQIHAARLTLPAGNQALDLGQGMAAEVRITAGRESYVLVLRPNLATPGVILIDAFSRPVGAAPTPEPVAAEAP